MCKGMVLYPSEDVVFDIFIEFYLCTIGKKLDRLISKNCVEIIMVQHTVYQGSDQNTAMRMCVTDLMATITVRAHVETLT